MVWWTVPLLSGSKWSFHWDKQVEKYIKPILVTSGSLNILLAKLPPALKLEFYDFTCRYIHLSTLWSESLESWDHVPLMIVIKGNKICCSLSDYMKDISKLYVFFLCFQNSSIIFLLKVTHIHMIYKCFNFKIGKYILKLQKKIRKERKTSRQYYYTVLFIIIS